MLRKKGKMAYVLIILILINLEANYELPSVNMAFLKGK